MSGRIGTFPYIGGKGDKASWIIEQIPAHETYIEPFGGSAGVLVNKPRSENEVYNDLNPDCVNFFRTCRDRTEELAYWVRYTPYSRQLHQRYSEKREDWPSDAVEQAGRFVFLQRASFGGSAIGKNASYSVANSGTPSSKNCGSYKWHQKVSHIAQIGERFRDVYIQCRDYREVVSEYDSSSTFFYFDPPYQEIGEKYYLTESAGFDHQEFVSILADIEGKWLVSYDENIPDGLQDGNRVVYRDYSAKSSREYNQKVETLTMNYDPASEPPFTGLSTNSVTEW